ncbi:uncharacterized protein LOC144121275 [Amblyomma americanum]
MESAANSDAVNGTPQKVVKPLSVGHGASGSSVGRNGDRGETIEDIISELNATAKKDEPLPEVVADVCRDSSDQWERKTESLASSPGTVGEATRSEAEPSTVLTDEPVGEEGEVLVPLTGDIPSQDGEKPAEATNGGTTELGSQESSKCSGATGAAVVQPEAEPELADGSSDNKSEEAKPNLAEADADPKEATTCEIKAPDEALQSPRRTSRQRTVSQKLAESNATSPVRMRRHGSEASVASSNESSPVKQDAKQCLTSDSESDVPLVQKRRKMLRSEDQPTVAVRTKRLTSDSESDTPLAQKRQKTTSTEGKTTAAIKAKKLASDSESDSPLAKRRSGPTRGPTSTMKVTERSQVKKASGVQSAEPPSKRRLSERSAKQSLETGKTSKDNKDQDVQGSEHSCTTDTETLNKKKTPSLTSKTKRKATQQNLPADSCGSTPAEQSLHEDHDESDGASELTKVKGNMSMLESALTTGSAPPAVLSKRVKKAPKGKELDKEDIADVLNISIASSSGDNCAVGGGKDVSKQTSSVETVEDVPSWSAHQFIESDRLLQKSISSSLKDREPIASPSYLMVEVPAGNARRTWGPALTRRRPTIVFGGCDPLNTYVNIEGVRVPLRQWQQVSRITPIVRLIDIFRCLPSA